MPVLHHIAKCSQLLFQTSYLFSPSLLLALETTVSAGRYLLCFITYKPSSNPYLPLITFAIPGFLGGLLLSCENPLAELVYSITLIVPSSSSTFSTIAWWKHKPQHPVNAIWSPSRSWESEYTGSMGTWHFRSPERGYVPFWISITQGPTFNKRTFSMGYWGLLTNGVTEMRETPPLFWTSHTQITTDTAIPL